MRCEAPRTIAIRNERYTVPCGSRYCPACGERWAKDQRVRAVAAAKHLPGDCALLTITGPGNAFFAPDIHQPQSRVRRRKTSWNRSARERWQELHRQASREPRRVAREAGCDWRVLFRTWEWQRRRVLHLHVVVPYGTTDERAATDAYVAGLHEHARRHGFGFVLGGDREDTPTWDHPPRVKAMDVNAVAAYVSKYVSKAGDTRNGMVNVARAAGMRGSVLYVCDRLVQASGVTMTSLRYRRRVVGRYPWALASEADWNAACVVDAVQVGRSRLTDDAIATIRQAAEAHPPTYVIEHATGRVTTPTAAPVPPGTRGHRPREDGRRWVLHLTLASVLLRVPEPENLGWIRTHVVGVGTSAL